MFYDMAWKEYLGKVVGQNQEGVTDRVFPYYLLMNSDVVTEADKDGRSQYARQLENVNNVVLRTVLPGNMLAFGSPDSTKMADLIVAAFTGAEQDAQGFLGRITNAPSSSQGSLREVARVLHPGGRFVASVNHPMRWPLPDSPDPADLTVTSSYFDRTPYVETDDDGRATYVEHHRTVGDRVRDVVDAGLVLDDLIEPEWPARNEQTWGGWSPLRGRLIPGTLVLVCHRP